MNEQVHPIEVSEPIPRELVRNLVNKYGADTVEEELRAVRQDIRRELARSNICQKMHKMFPDAWIDQEGDTLVVSINRAFMKTISNDYVEALDKLRNDSEFSDIQRNFPQITAILTNPEGSIRKVFIRIDKERV